MCCLNLAMSVSKLDICVPPLLSDTALLWSMAFWHLDRSFVADQDSKLCKEKLACTSTEVQHQPLSKIWILKKKRCQLSPQNTHAAQV